MQVYTLEDPRPTHAENPYTFFVPSEEDLAQIEVGDLVKLIFVPTSEETQWAAERMWVIVEEMGPEGLRGVLDNIPRDMPGLNAGDEVRFEMFHVISIYFMDPEKAARYHKTTRGYLDRCAVDRCVLDGSAKVHWLYRDPELWTEEGDEYPDSGWRIRGDFRDEVDEKAALEAREGAYVALGAVLNRDDSWLHLVDAPSGSAYIWDWKQDTFVEDTEWQND